MATRGRKSTIFTICGQTKTLDEWAKFANLSANAIRYRLSKGWPIEKAIAIPASENVFRRTKAEKPETTALEADESPEPDDSLDEPDDALESDSDDSQVESEDDVENIEEIPVDAPRNDDVSEPGDEDE